MVADLGNCYEPGRVKTKRDRKCLLLAEAYEQLELLSPTVSIVIPGPVDIVCQDVPAEPL